MSQIIESNKLEKINYNEVNDFNQLREERIMKNQLRENLFEQEMLKKLEKCIAKNGSPGELAEIRRNAYNDSVFRRLADRQTERALREILDQGNRSFWETFKINPNFQY
jgi:hypothetical protein